MQQKKPSAQHETNKQGLKNENQPTKKLHVFSSQTINAEQNLQTAAICKNRLS